MYLIILFFVMFVVFFLCSFIIIARTSHSQKRAQNEAKNFRLNLARDLADDFERIGWGTWGMGAHLTDEQATRMKQAALSTRMKLIEYHPDLHYAVVEDEHGIYHIDEFGYCSCPDCEERHLPCKHIYFAFLRIMDSLDD